jgi:hypothetical protein
VTEIIAALHVAWDANATLNAIPNPFAELAADGSTYPNADYQIVGGLPPQDTFDRTTIETTDLQVRVRHTTLSTLHAYSRALTILLHFPATKLATEEPVAVMSQRQLQPPKFRTFSPYGPAGETVHESLHTYRIQTHRPTGS